MIEFLNKMLAFIGTIFAALLAIFLFVKSGGKKPEVSPHIRAINDLEAELDEIEKKKKELVENGPEELTDQEEIDYWKNN